MLTSFNKNVNENEKDTVKELIDSLNLTREMNCKNFKEFRKKFDEIYQKEITLEIAQKIYM